MKLIRKRNSPVATGDVTTTADGHSGINRREFLRRSGITLTGTAVATGLSPVMMRRAEASGSDSARQEGVTAEIRRSVCTHCSVGCGVIAELQNGVWTGQEPDLDSPINLGAHCAKGAALREHGHSEKRVKYPMKLVDGKWKRLNYAEPWLTGDTYNMSIGQGFLLATPLQMANSVTVIANRGYLYRPQLVDHIMDAEGKIVRAFKPDLRHEVAVDPAHLDTVREGMYGAVNWPHGTAANARIPGIAVAGKTGTAEYSRDWDKDGTADRDAKGNLPTHAWFVAFAPYQDPEIAVTVFVANGGEGSSVAAPVAARVLRAYFGVDAPAPAPSPTPAAGRGG